MNEIFDLCVRFLIWLAKLTGTTYKEINVIIFCIMWPAFTLFLIGYVIHLKRIINRIKP